MLTVICQDHLQANPEDRMDKCRCSLFPCSHYLSPTMFSALATGTEHQFWFASTTRLWADGRKASSLGVALNQCIYFKRVTRMFNAPPSAPSRSRLSRYSFLPESSCPNTNPCIFPLRTQTTAVKGIAHAFTQRRGRGIRIPAGRDVSAQCWKLLSSPAQSASPSTPSTRQRFSLR